MAAFVREAVIAELERREDSDNPEGRPLGDGL